MLGFFKLILGCMFSGKTTELQKEFAEWSSIGKIPLCINYIGDNRYGNIYNHMYNHNNNSIECIKVKNLADVKEEDVKKSEIILINEGQFFSDIVEYTLKWCEEYGKKVYVCGLDGDFQRKPFGRILELIPFADDYVKLTAYCKDCGNGTKALFTKRITSNMEQEVIGGADVYKAVCRKCYLKKE